MILTGKAKEDFEKWLSQTFELAHYNVELWFKNEKEATQNALIIEWFDSVGIYIELGRFITGLKFEFWHYTISDTRGIHLNNHMGNTVKEDSRHKATKQAIIKANEIYNNKKS